MYNCSNKIAGATLTLPLAKKNNSGYLICFQSGLEQQIQVQHFN
jgi:hypothetical protein